MKLQRLFQAICVLNAIQACFVAYHFPSFLTISMAYFAGGPAALYCSETLNHFFYINSEGSKFKLLRSYLLWAIVVLEFLELNYLKRAMVKNHYNLMRHGPTHPQANKLARKQLRMGAKLDIYKQRADKYIRTMPRKK